MSSNALYNLTGEPLTYISGAAVAQYSLVTLDANAQVVEAAASADDPIGTAMEGADAPEAALPIAGASGSKLVMLSDGAGALAPGDDVMPSAAEPGRVAAAASGGRVIGKVVAGAAATNGAAVQVLFTGPGGAIVA